MSMLSTKMMPAVGVLVPIYLLFKWLVLLVASGTVLCKTLGGLDAGHRADPHHGLVQPETTRPRPDLRRGEAGRNGWARSG